MQQVARRPPARGHDQPVLHDVSDPGAPWVVAFVNERERGVGHHFRRYSARHTGVDAHAEIELALLQRQQSVSGAIDAHVEFEIGEARPELVELGHEIPKVIAANRNRDAAGFRGIGRDGGERPLGAIQHRNNLSQQPLAGACQRQRFALSAKQLDADDLLQPGEFGGNGRHGEAQLGRSRLQRALLRNQLKSAQFTEIEVFNAHGGPSGSSSQEFGTSYKIIRFT